MAVPLQQEDRMEKADLILVVHGLATSLAITHRTLTLALAAPGPVAEQMIAGLAQDLEPVVVSTAALLQSLERGSHDR